MTQAFPLCAVLLGPRGDGVEVVVAQPIPDERFLPAHRVERRDGMVSRVNCKGCARRKARFKVSPRLEDV